MAEQEPVPVVLEKPSILPVQETNPPARVAPVPYWSYWVPVVTAIIVMMQTLGLAWIARMATDTATSVEKVHVAVNSERTATLEKIEELNKEIRALAELNAGLRQKKKETK